ncbi:MAG: hypothetical protein CME85_10890 [Henriciella sp.]|uniref:hypothetical protein n=1 Tax=Henriciella sp. TaxID=1968823 RepID=UPI000C0E75D1|nr:hypothetical protein [Henriciella sp.]MAN74253.1 hypothetical protein [Henriciella sp.]MBF33194.1 hypothetical protein [Hyphomonadaceae bacterium]MBK75986.1 hypothetical protein [Henriciella sp.]PHR70746.1 MAG: hypothetical protein COA64_15800 [Henriciella sp.]|tara:strand:- start:699 stop:1301 length:603 start_codon:yes stop_codon:yes gene_type:complete
MVRSSLICLTAVLLAACESAGGDGKLTPTLEGGISAPEGASPVLVDFVNVCSSLVLEARDPGVVFTALGWEIPDGTSPEEMAAFGGAVAEKEMTADMPLMLQLMPMDFPHVDGMTCSVTGYGANDIARVDIAGLDGIEGMMGKVDTYEKDGDSVGLGRWSGVTQDGSVVTIYAMRANRGEVLNLSLNKTKPVEPALNATK